MKRFTISQEGYNVDEVNRFIDVVIKRLEKLNSENSLLQMKISSLEEDLESAKKTEAKMSEAFMAAQSASEKIKSLAREEASVILEEARNNANSIMHESLVNAQKVEDEASLLRKNVVVYKNRIKNIIRAQLELAEDLDKYDIDKK